MAADKPGFQGYTGKYPHKIDEDPAERGHAETNGQYHTGVSSIEMAGYEQKAKLKTFKQARDVDPSEWLTKANAVKMAIDPFYQWDKPREGT